MCKKIATFCKNAQKTTKVCKNTQKCATKIVKIQKISTAGKNLHWRRLPIHAFSISESKLGCPQFSNWWSSFHLILCSSLDKDIYFFLLFLNITFILCALCPKCIFPKNSKNLYFIFMISMAFKCLWSLHLKIDHRRKLTKVSNKYQKYKWCHGQYYLLEISLSLILSRGGRIFLLASYFLIIFQFACNTKFYLQYNRSTTFYLKSFVSLSSILRKIII